MKRNTKLYFRTFYISSVLILCLIFGFMGVALAYENTVQTAFGEYKKAIEFSDGSIRIFDFIINFTNV
ncbi:MAG: hypothetical protein ACI4U6_00900 [Acutalibacteraceae bacterium]